MAKSSSAATGLPDPEKLPDWPSPQAINQVASAFGTSGFTGGLNYCRNLDRNSELWQTSVGQKVRVPALFMIGNGDSGLSTLGMEEMTAGMLKLVPDLRGESIHVLGSGVPPFSVRICPV